MNTSPLQYIQYRIPVPQEFHEVFSHFYFAENQSGQTVSKTLLPSYETIMIFNFGENVQLQTAEGFQMELDKCLVLGPVKKAFEYSLPAKSRILVAGFKDDAFYRFFGSASIVKPLPVNPDSLLDENCFTALWSELRSFDDPYIQVNHILAFCKPYLRARHSLIEQITDLKTSSFNPVKTVAGNNNQSERLIQNIHKKHLGYSAKEMNRYLRFLKAIQIIQNIASKPTKDDWFEIIETCGYYDQSQMINDFKHYINLSPTKYLKLQRDICNPVI